MNNLVWHNATVTRDRREQKNEHKGAVFWLTGLSGSGKSTLGHAVEEHLYQDGFNTYVLDGDNIRHGLCSDLGFSNEDRKENIRRIAHLSKLFIDAGIILLAAFVSPFKDDRDFAKSIIGDDFHEIYCDCSLAVCESRDVKGLYKKARAGKIPLFTGIDSPYQIPECPDLIIKTNSNIDTSIKTLYEYIKSTL